MVDYLVNCYDAATMLLNKVVPWKLRYETDA